MGQPNNTLTPQEIQSVLWGLEGAPIGRVMAKIAHDKAELNRKQVLASAWQAFQRSNDSYTYRNLGQAIEKMLD